MDRAFRASARLRARVPGTYIEPFQGNAAHCAAKPSFDAVLTVKFLAKMGGAPDIPRIMPIGGGESACFNEIMDC